MDNSKAFNRYINEIRTSMNYRHTLAIINQYLLEMQDILTYADFNKRMEIFKLIIIIPENEEAVDLFESYSGLKIFNKDDIINRLIAFNEYKYERIYGDFFTEAIIEPKYTECISAVFGLLPSPFKEQSAEENIYKLQYSLRRLLHERLIQLDYNAAEFDESIRDLICRITGDRTGECLKTILHRDDVDDIDFLSFDDINNIRIYFDLEEFVE